MRTVFISFDTASGGFGFSGEVYSLFSAGGIDLSAVINASPFDEVAFKKIFEYAKTNFDCIVMCGGTGNTYDVKDIISQSLNLPLSVNNDAKEKLSGKISDPMFSEELFLLPEDASLIPNEKGLFQGYMTEGDQTVIVVSDVREEAQSMIKEFVLPYLQNKLGITPKTYVIKLFGVPTELLEGTLNGFCKNYPEGYRLTAENSFGVVTVTLYYDGKRSSDEVNGVLRDLTEIFSKWTFATEDITLGEGLIGLLKLKNKKISVAESFTGGGVASQLVKVSGASEVLSEGIVAYTEEAKIKRLGVKESTLKKFGAVSEDTAYEMAVGLLSRGTSDIVIATTGLAGPNSDGSGKPVGLCYIAVGTLNGIYVYKYNFKGTREKVIKSGINAALYKAFKLVKDL